VGGFHQREDKEILTGQKMNICETTIPGHDRQKFGVGSSPSIPCPLSICLINSPLSLLFIFSLSLFHPKERIHWPKIDKALILTCIQDYK
jgi:hypothetical protein